MFTMLLPQNSSEILVIGKSLNMNQCDSDLYAMWSMILLFINFISKDEMVIFNVSVTTVISKAPLVTFDWCT
jgi:hypothetical protein